MKDKYFKVLVVILVGLGLGIVISGTLAPENRQISGANETQKSLSEEIESYDSSENISEDPNLEQFKLNIRETDSGWALTKYDGPSWNYNAVLRGKVTSGSWDEWEYWEGPGNYSTKNQDFKVVSFPAEKEGPAYLEQEVEIPENGLTILSVQLKELTRNQFPSCNSNIELRAENTETGQGKLLNQTEVDDKETTIQVSLADFEGETILVRYIHPEGDECSPNYVSIKEFVVTNHFN